MRAFEPLSVAVGWHERPLTRDSTKHPAPTGKLPPAMGHRFGADDLDCELCHQANWNDHRLDPKPCPVTRAMLRRRAAQRRAEAEERRRRYQAKVARWRQNAWGREWKP